MPQLDTSTWLLVIFLMTTSLFCAYQLKMNNQNVTSISSLNMHTNPEKLNEWKFICPIHHPYNH